MTGVRAGSSSSCWRCWLAAGHASAAKMANTAKPEAPALSRRRFMRPRGGWTSGDVDRFESVGGTEGALNPSAGLAPAEADRDRLPDVLVGHVVGRGRNALI